MQEGPGSFPILEQRQANPPANWGAAVCQGLGQHPLVQATALLQAGQGTAEPPPPITLSHTPPALIAKGGGPTGSGCWGRSWSHLALPGFKSSREGNYVKPRTLPSPVAVQRRAHTTGRSCATNRPRAPHPGALAPVGLAPSRLGLGLGRLPRMSDTRRLAPPRLQGEVRGKSNPASWGFVLGVPRPRAEQRGSRA